MNKDLKTQNTYLPVVQNKMWFSLKEACEPKRLNYKTACNKSYLQPNNGHSETKIGVNTKKFRRDTIINWLFLSDFDLENTKGENDEHYLLPNKKNKKYFKANQHSIYTI